MDNPAFCVSQKKLNPKPKLFKNLKCKILNV